MRKVLGLPGGVRLGSWGVWLRPVRGVLGGGWRRPTPGFVGVVAETIRGLDLGVSCAGEAMVKLRFLYERSLGGWGWLAGKMRNQI
jgi:hypothetical protein